MFDFTGPATLILPVDLLFFQGRAEGAQVKLNWATATETGNSHFEVQRSADGRTFEVLGEVAGAGDSQGLREYSWVDPKPLAGLNYYRLRQVDFDGQFEFSNLVTVEVDKDLVGGGIGVAPNPVAAGGFIDVALPPALAETGAEFLLLDFSGRVAARLQPQSLNGLRRLELGGIAPGVYTLQVRSANTLYSQKLIIQ